jgi:pyruvate/2-oxoglutarate dehydrogenase complex dihydrolipoamide acyltransferase (E2) component
MSPVILPPQVAIGAVGRIRKVPCLSEDGDADYEARSSRLAVQSVMNVFWAADHRVGFHGLKRPLFNKALFCESNF